jgi:LysM domain-containing protein
MSGHTSLVQADRRLRAWRRSPGPAGPAGAAGAPATRIKRLRSARPSGSAVSTTGTGPRPGSAVAPAAARVIRARVLAWGCLVSVVLAAVLIVTSTLDPHAKAANAGITAAGGQARSRCCWIVEPGQTLDSIAAKESVLPSAMTRANPGVVPGRLVPGQRLRIPA